MGSQAAFQSILGPYGVYLQESLEVPDAVDLTVRQPLNYLAGDLGLLGQGVGEASAAEKQQASPGPHRVPRRWRLGEEARPRGGRCSRAPAAAKFSTIPQGARPGGGWCGAGSRRNAPGASSEEEERGVRACRAGSLRGRRVGGGDGRDGGRGWASSLVRSRCWRLLHSLLGAGFRNDLAANSACLRRQPGGARSEAGAAAPSTCLDARPGPGLQLALSLRAHRRPSFATAAARPGTARPSTARPGGLRAPLRGAPSAPAPRSALLRPEPGSTRGRAARA